MAQVSPTIDDPDARKGRRALAFSAAGHFLFHYFAAMYFTIVLAIAKDWTASDYETLIALWTPASALIGLAALPAGRLADTWSAPGMLAVMFLGMGAATAAAGFAGDTVMLGAMLAAIGLFGAIYHPVGIPWLIKTSTGATGQKLAVNGIFGGLGAAAAGALSGVLIDALGWRGAFMVPGTLCVVAGLAMVWCLKTGRVVEGVAAAREDVGGRDGRGHGAAFAALLFPMFAIGLIYNTTQTAMPKLFEENMLGWLGGDISRIGFAVGAVYTAGALMDRRLQRDPDGARRARRIRRPRRPAAAARRAHARRRPGGVGGLSPPASAPRSGRAIRRHRPTDRSSCDSRHGSSRRRHWRAPS